MLEQNIGMAAAVGYVNQWPHQSEMLQYRGEAVRGNQAASPVVTRRHVNCRSGRMSTAPNSNEP